MVAVLSDPRLRDLDAASPLTDIPLSFGQRALWFLDRLAPGNPAYVIAGAARASGGLDTAALRRAAVALVSRHPALRTTFHPALDGPVQRISPEGELEFVAEDASGLSRQALLDRVDEVAFRPFDLERGPLLRIGLFHLAGGDDALLLSIHHVVSDFWSLAVLVRELGALYGREAGLTPQDGPVLPPPPAVDMETVVAREEELLARGVGETLWERRRAALAGFPLVLDLPADRPRSPIQTYRGAARAPRLAPALVDSLRRLARKRGATLYMALLAAYEAVLARWSGQDRFVVGCPTTGRSSAELSGLVGYLINPVAIPADLSGEPGFGDLLERARAAALSAFADQALPFPLLAERLQPERDPARSPVFQTLLVLQKGRRSGEDRIASLAVGEEGAEIDFGPVRLLSLPLAEPGVQWDLAVAWAESGGGLTGRWQYNRDLFEAPTMERMAICFASLLEAVVASAAGVPGSLAVPVAALPLLPAGERAQLLWEWNDTARPLPGPEPLVHEQLAQQARRRPGAMALVAPEGRLTYGELLARSERLARHLRALGVGPERRVAVCAGQATHRLVGIVAALRAGGAYVPFDPTYPAERLGFILAETAAPVLLTERTLAGLLPPAETATVVYLDPGEDWDRAPTAGPLGSGGEAPANLACVLYTSGSTGRPKGVALSHAALANFTAWHRDYYGVGPEDRTSQLASPAFDAALMEIWPTLAAGGALHAPEATVRLSARDTLRWWAEQGVTLSFLTTPLAEALLDEEPPGLPLRLRTLITGGDRLRRRPRPGTPFRLVNVYGPTEVTVCCTATPVDPGEGVPTLGRPRYDTAVLLLDPEGRPAPIGVTGEVYVAGSGLARGYHGRPEQTAERFVPDPWGFLRGEPGARLYKTGDLMRRSPDGDLQFLGRADHQVKLRGFRIELGEIEAVLAGHPGVREVAVLAREERPGDLRLVACVAPMPPMPQMPPMAAVSARGPGAAELRGFLAERLPDYMVPAAFVLLDALPLSPNGKIDRRALARLAPAVAPGLGRTAPRTPVEELLAGIWSETLGVEAVGVEDDFFQLGGHSLLATRVAARVRESFGVELPLPRLFAAPTLGALAREIATLQQAGIGPSSPLRPLPRPAGERSELPASFAQERLWFLDRLEPGSAAYNLPGAVRFTGPLDVAALAAALDGLRFRHEALRTTFAEARGGGAVQVVAPASPASPRTLPVVDLSSLPPRGRESEQERLGAEEAARPFDLARGPLLRTALLRSSDAEHLFLLNFHHIVGDGASVGILVRELGELYRAAREGRPAALPALPVQFGDFAAWQREQLTGEILARQLAWWRERLAGAPALLELPADRPRPAVQSQRGGHVSLVLDAGLRGRLAALGRRGEATLFMTLLAGWKALLARLSGQEDLVIGSPVTGRDRAELFGLLGFFAGTVALRTDLSGDPGFRAVQARVRQSVLGALAHQDLPFERLVEELAPERSLSHAPLVQAVFALQATTFPAFDLPGIAERRIDLPRETAKFDLVLELEERDGCLSGDLEYSRDLWDEPTVARWAGHLTRLLEGIAADPETPLSRLSLLSAAERAQLLVEWNDTRSEIPFVAVHEQVLEQARLRPGALALRSAGATVTYGELAARAGRLAGHLRSLGVGPEVPVAILLEPSPEQVTAALAALLTGGAYLPLDPAYPEERLAYVLADSRARVVVTRGRYSGRLPEGVRIVDLDEGTDLDAPAVAAPPSCDPGNLAYIVYTSGSTGRPKGVEIAHGGLANLVRWHREYHRVTPEDRATLAASPAFDASVWETWPVLASGASLHVPDGETRLSAPALLAFWAEEGITLPFLPTPLAEAVLEEEPVAGLSVRLLFTGGDRLHRRPGPRHSFRLVNHYGPSENTVAATAAPVSPAGAGGTDLPPIGRPLANTRLAVVDRAGLPVPLGVPGELWIAGTGLARGYRGRPDLTAERFIPNPWAPGGHGERLYRTGDLVRFRPTGELDFLGRGDRQVKLRGFRIELGEIEAVLAAHPAVEQAAVLVREDRPSERRLVAYVAAEDPAGLDAHLRECLPDYMIPAVVVLPALPLTANGKVDTAALSRIASEPAEERGWVAPQGEIEELLAAIWAEVLGRERIGREDDFFQLGGHSLLATRVVSQLRQRLRVEIPVRALFEAPTLSRLAREIAAALPHPAAAAPPVVGVSRGARGDGLPLSFSQEGLWFLDRLAPESPLQNIVCDLRLEGRLDLPALAAGLATVVGRHEVLRTTFREAGGRPASAIAPRLDLDLPVVDLSELPAAVRTPLARRLAAEDALRPFDLAAGPLVRVAVLRLGEREHHALVALHHIVADGWSMGIFVREIAAGYGAALAGLPVDLPALPFQYADYAAWQREWLSTGALDGQLAWWRQRLAGSPALLALPTDRPRPPVASHRGGIFPLRLDGDRVDRLRALSKTAGATLFMTLLAAWEALLGRLTGQAVVPVGSPVANRTRREFEGLIGLFVNTLVHRGDVAGDPLFPDLLARVREELLGAFAHQDLPFERLVAELQPERSLGHSPLFQAFFSFQNTFAVPSSLPGLALAPLPPAATPTAFDLTLNLEGEAEPREGERGLAGALLYRRDLFDRATVQRFAGSLTTLLAALAEEPGRRLSALPLLGAAERHQLLAEWNDTAVSATSTLALDLFAARAASVPDRVAIEAADLSAAALTYGELDRRAAALARRLVRAGVGPESRVGICLPRSADLAVALLAVWKAGGAWLPLDPGYPRERLELLLADSGAQAVVTRASLSGSLPAELPRVILGGPPALADGEPELPPAADPGRLAYVIYTSGSTGRPKGVLVEQGSLASLLAAARRDLFASSREEPGWGEGEILPVVAAFSFDIFLFELLCPLLAGGTALLVPHEPVLDVPALVGRLPRATRLHAVPALMQQIVEQVAAAGLTLPGLKTAFVGGEAVPAALLAGMRRAFPAAELRVLYGPTEGTILAASWRVGAGERPERSLLGKPLSGITLVPRDPWGNPVPIGVAGEIWIGGAGVARGYLSQLSQLSQLDPPERTAESFPRLGGERFYRTGDLARRLPDGTLEFLGRGDRQVKVRGFRIELGEIEAALAAHPQVAAAAVLVRGSAPGERSLVACFVAAAAGDERDLPALPSEDELRAHLASRLPAYMVPAAFVPLSALPLTPHGKVDRRALEQTVEGRLGHRGPRPAAVPPRTPVERRLAGIWGEVLDGGSGLSVEDNFFALGGHSLLATRGISRVNEVFGLSLPVRTLFEAPTLAALARVVAAEVGEAGGAAGAAGVPAPRPRGPRSLLSHAQERLWFLDRLEPGSPLYNIAAHVALAGRLDLPAFRQALAEIVRRHEALRTRFVFVDGQPLQETLSGVAPGLPVVDVQALSPAARTAEAERLAREEARRPFDLATGPLLRSTLLRLAPAEHRVLFTQHHIVSDGWSMGVFVHELVILYGAFAAGRPGTLRGLPELPLQYPDFALWQREYLEGGVLAEQLAYWRERLAGAPVLELPTDRPRPAVPRNRGGLLPVALPPELSKALAAFAREHSATPFMALLAAWTALLGRLSGQDDLVVGSPVANRTRRELEGLIGFFVNTLALRASLAGEPGFDGLLARVREAALAAYAHQDLPFERLVEEVAPERSLSRSPLFQVMFALQNAPMGDLALPGLDLTVLPVDVGVAKFDLTLVLFEGPEGFSGTLEHDRDLFDRTTVLRLAGHLTRLVSGALARPGLPLSQLPLLTAAEEAQLVREWNDTGAGPVPETRESRESRVDLQVAAWSRHQPDALAIVSPAGALTYGELDRRAGRLARHLAARGVGPEVRVAVSIAPGPDWAIALLGVLQAGGAYVALDPGYPEDRRAYVLADSGAPVVLAGIAGIDDLPEGAALPAPDLSPSSLAYVIYTSGSTGRPKGVLLSHGGLANLVRWHGEALSPAPGDRATQVASPAFDASVLELWPCLAAGATLRVAPWEARLDPEAMLRFWESQGITLAFLPTPLTEAVLDHLEEGRSAAPASLRALTTGGDRLHRGPSPRLPFRLANLYGPTESTVVATCAPLAAGGVDLPGLPPIGRPLPGTRALVLDRAGLPVPLGAAGELHLGGTSLARGYHGRPDLTAERFVPDPSEDGVRLYRTGDLVRHLPDGRLDFLGRLDHQVKIRGFRIELGEIEAALAGHPAVAEAAVLAVGEERKRRLAAFAVPRPGEAPTAAELRRALAQGLPDYMVPSLLEVLPALPTTTNGKVDRRELERRAQAARLGLAEETQGPRTPTEELVAAAFREILGRERFGVDESFFELGGHSLMATRVVARLEASFGVELPLRLLFESPTVAGLSREIEALEAISDPAAPPAPPAPPILRVPRDRPLPLSFAQERLWFLDRLAPGSPVYNIPTVLHLSGRLDLPALRGSLDEIVRRHEALRTTFAELPGGAVQVIAPRLAIPVPQVDLGRLPAERRAALAEALAREGARQPFDLGRGPLLRALLVSLGIGGESDPGEHLLLLSLHHIVADGWSMGVLVREFTALYGAALEGRPSPLPELPFQYADFAAWQRQWLEGGALERQLAWWWEALAGAPTLLDLPGDRPRPPVASSRGGAAPLHLPAGLAEALQTLARKRGATLHMTLFAGLATLLSRLSGQPDLLVGTPVANRTRLSVEELIGFFVNTLALRADLSGAPGFPELLSRVRAMALGAYARQDLPFERLVEALQPDRGTDAPPVFQVLFVLQNAPLGALALPGLSLEPLEVGTGTSKFDLTLALLSRGGALDGSLEYNRDLFDATTAARFAGHLETLFREIAEDPERRVAELPLLQPAERQAVVREWNAAPRELADSLAPISDLTAPIRARAVEERDRAAVSCHGAVLTYGELVRRANQLARHLVGMGVRTDTILGICLDRSLDMAVAVVAALEAGIAYLPLDPAYPPERLALMLDDCEPKVILTQAALLPGLAALLAARPAPPRVLCLDTDRAVWTAWSAAALPPRAQPANLIYMVYTSGSTGRPKGIAMMRQALANLLAWQEGGTSLGARARTLQFALLSFDVSFQEFISTWRTGGTVVLLAEETRRDAFALLSLLAKERIERLYLPYIVLRQLAEVALEERGGSAAADLALSDVITAGEQLQVTPSLLDWFATLPPGCRLQNQYGPSEGHVVTAVTLGADPADRAAWPALPPVGRTISNLRVYLMDSELGPLPAGVPGEVGVAGIALARGYLGRPDLTAEKFVPDPFCDAPGERLYKTGDLARFRADGQVEYLGRLDGQVKIRGFRIELGEVEAVLAQHPEVRGVAVVARDEAVTGARRLVAYLVVDAARIPAVRGWLKGRLPDYMVPSAFVPLDALPLHPSGKLNRRALPAVQLAAPQAAGAGPLNPAEEVLAGIWTDLLELDPAARLGPESDFFALGGHSLLATRVVSRVRTAFGVDLPLRTLFESSTLSGMAAAISASAAGAGAAGEALPAPPIRPLPAGPEFPLSFAQERLWFLDQLAPGGATYNMPGALRLRGRLDVPALAATLAGLAARHETLRTTFAVRGGAPVQVIAPGTPATPASAPPVPLVDLRALPEPEREREVRRLAAAEVGRPFDLGRGPLVRAALLRLTAEEHVALYTLHHIISDGWSMGVFVREVAALYRAAVLGVPADLPPLPVQYRDYSVWQREWLAGERLAAELAWWRGTLAGAPALLELPLDRPRPSVQRFRGARRIVHLPRELAAAVTALCRQAGVTPFMTLLAVFQTLLSRLSGQADLAVGSPIAGRSQREVEGLIGFFVNTLVLRTSLADRPPFRRLLDRVRETTLGAFAHQDLPFDRLVEELRPERDLAYAPLFQVMFALQNAPMGTLSLPGLDLEPVELEVGAAKFDLVLSLGETARGLEGGLGFNRDLFDPTTAERISGCFRTLLEAAVAAPERPVDELPLLAAPERHQLLREWSGEPREYPGSELLHELFEAQAARTPEAKAVWCAGTWMTYRELDERAERVAARLRGMGVGPEGIVGVCLTRSFDLVAGLIGILKAGAAYVPLDPGLPAERLAYLVEDSRAGAVLVEEATADLLPGNGVPRVFLGGDAPLLTSPLTQPSPSQGGGTRPPKASPAEEISPDHPAYVIYTSGSTGRPKGVVIPHRAISARLRFACADDLHPGERMIQKTTLSFDVSVFEVFAPLLTGGRLLLPRPGGEKDPAYLLSLAAEHGVTRLSFPPALLALLLEQEALPSLRSLRMVVTGGETVPPELPGRFYSRMAAHLENRYGPTEATISVTAWRCPRGEAPAAWSRLPIGRPIAVSEIYFLDASFQPVPPGVAGELTIGGVCLARGYLGRPELTAEVFVPHPFAETPGERLYRTGDVARQRSDSAIDFLGRIDGQVKVRGFRVELGEIEAALREHPDLKEVAVADREDPATGSRRLVAWLVPKPGAQVTPAAVRELLQGKIPAYMVPSAFVVLPALPLTPSGKVDRQALPEPEAGPDETAAGEGPRGPLEELLAGIWADLLGVGVERIGREASFFELGGHSLLATRAVSRLREALGVELPLRRLFEEPTLAGLAAAVEEARARGDRSPAPPLLPAPRDGRPLPLSFAQERLWFLEQLEPGGASYVMPAAVRFHGRLDALALETALAAIVRRHEALRTVFRSTEGRPEQAILPDLPGTAVLLPTADLAALPGPLRETELLRLARESARRPFDLAAGPLFRAARVRLAEKENAVLCSMHHIVSDGWSVGIFVRELAALYTAAVLGDPPALPPLPVQYADFAVWQRGWLAGPVLAAEVDGWRERLSGAPALLELPTDRPRPPLQRYRGAQLPFRLAADLSRRLERLGRRRGATPFMLLLAGFAAVLSRWSGQDDLVVGSPVANRTRREVEGLIGFFVNTLVLRARLDGAPTFSDLLGRVRETTLLAYAHQDLPFEKLVEALAPERSLAHAPIFQVLLILQNTGMGGGSLNLPGLTLTPIEADSGTAKLDLTLSLAATAEGFAGGWEYDRDLFDPATIERLSGHLERLLGALADGAAAPVGELPLLSEAELAQLAEWSEWRRGPEPAVPEVGVHDLFFAQAAKTPEAEALVAGAAGAAGAERLTYAELAARVERLAGVLRALGVRPEDRVGIALDRTAALPVALLAVLAAGGAYVPMDPAFPRERLRLMLEDSGARLLLTQEDLLERLPDMEVERLLLTPSGLPAADLPAAPAGEGRARGDLAYVIYTSGSTGRPKGVAVRHAGVVAFLASMAAEPGLTAADTLLAVTTISFDIAGLELYLPLAVGARVVLASREETADGGLLAAALARAGATVLQATPATWRLLLAGGWAGEPRLRAFCGGEALPRELAAELRGRVAELWNLYGPTETTIWSTVERVEEREAWAGAVPIGHPIARTSARVLDRSLGAVPVGVAGELYLGGAGVARGYHGRPDLTAERFLPDPWSAEPGARHYRTGDVVCHLPAGPSGALAYLGRADYQVKVRGFRIELGEIEAVLAAHPGVRQALVVAREDQPGDRRLVAYVVPREEEPGDLPAALRAHAAERLPAYLLPAAVVVLPVLPLTPNGKVDRKALPAPEWGSGTAHVAPRNPLEEVLAGIWCEVLGVAKAGIHDNFFRSGGHSLLATQLVARVQKAFQVELPLRRLFEMPTIEALAAAVEAAEAKPGQSRKIARVLLKARELARERAAVSG